MNSTEHMGGSRDELRLCLIRLGLISWTGRISRTSEYLLFLAIILILEPGLNLVSLCLSQRLSHASLYLFFGGGRVVGW